MGKISLTLLIAGVAVTIISITLVAIYGDEKIISEICFYLLLSVPVIIFLAIGYGIAAIRNNSQKIMGIVSIVFSVGFAILFATLVFIAGPYLMAFR